MDEYITLGHMTLIEDENTDGYYLPHHAVIKRSSETTKVRVVFDASAKTTTGLSLNDVLMVGPTIQNTIFEQILRFRTHVYVLTADIEKMYRQILIHPDDRKFQKVVWYHQGKHRIFVLNTVTFGVASAPFLAIRTIHQLAREKANSFPRASKLILRDFYVDDFLSGANSLEEIISIRDEMIELLNQGGFQIRQWASNHKSALTDIYKKIFNLDCVVKENPIQKTLGIIWDSEKDLLQYTSQTVDYQTTSTKRKLLSEIAKIFDPIGLLGPVVLYAKVLMQECWKAKINWDESLPQDIHTKWKQFSTQLPFLKEVSFDRQFLIQNPVTIEIHGFCDACIYGYGACLYARSIDAQGRILVKLVCSKSRVAPLSGITIPRLELCAASILKKLYLNTKIQFEVPVDQVTFWSDSTIVLSWIKKAPHLLRTFESNRVADIQTLDGQVQWKHVRSEENPADSLSRGQLPVDFIKNPLWNSGPSWLSLSEKDWPKSIGSLPSEIPGLKQETSLKTSISEQIGTKLCNRVSSYSALLRIIGYCLRWRNLTNLKEKGNRGRWLSLEEYRAAEIKLIAIIQRESFPLAIKRLTILDRSKPGDKTPHGKKGSPFDDLNPFLDENGIIHVGGRLKKAKLNALQKHPMLLPSRHRITEMIIRETHERNCHAGIQSTLYNIRQRFWILNGKDQIRRIIRRCIECIRHKPKITYAQMADLPTARVTESPAFTHTGVDFFGPIYIKEKRYRCKTILKTYGCVFICMASKAVHLELATDLSTEGFLTALRRFIGRRGIPEHIYSDNGTNFIGANRELSEIYSLFEKIDFQNSIRHHALSKRIQWHFNPPASPHFGGLWEAAVKSVKHHLKRVLKDQNLTYEQINTFLIEIEAILNSRPLCTLSSDPNDPQIITPAHLLIGKPITLLPEKTFVSVPDNRLSTYNFITKARQDFWSRWHKEYLNELQTRQKWHESTAQLKPGSIVLLLEDNVACARWPLGVIVEVFPGSDGVARVATVKTANGVYKRNITRLCLLPVT